MDRWQHICLRLKMSRLKPLLLDFAAAEWMYLQSPPLWSLPLFTVVLIRLFPTGTARVGDRSPLHSCTCSGSHHWKTGSTHQTAVTLCWSLNQGDWQTVQNVGRGRRCCLPIVTWLIPNKNKCRLPFIKSSFASFQIAPAEGMDAKQRMVIIVGPPEAQFKVHYLHDQINAHNPSGRWHV